MKRGTKLLVMLDGQLYPATYFKKVRNSDASIEVCFGFVNGVDLGIRRITKSQIKEVL